MKQLGYYNGKIAPLDEIQVPMCDRGCFFGDGVYDAAISQNGVIFLLDEHIERFFNSAELLQISLNITKQDLKDLLISLMARLDDTDLMVYWQVTRGTAPRDHLFPDGEPNLWVMIRPQKIWDCSKPFSLSLQEDLRHYLCHIKTLNLAANIMTLEKARQAGCHEAVMHRNGRITEGAKHNISIISNGVFKTAPADNLILPGISRARLIMHCQKLGIPVEEVPFCIDELFNADEVIVSSSGAPCVPAKSIDGAQAGGKAPDILNRLRDSVLDELKASTAKSMPEDPCTILS
jgi:D-alanine transaminase